MKHVISVGGGISSTYLLVDKVLTKYGRHNVIPVICALADENTDVWRLCDAVEKECKIKIQRIHGIVKHVPTPLQAASMFINYKLPAWAWSIVAPHKEIRWTKKPVGIWDVFFYTGMMGNPFADPCSRMLKRELMAAFMESNFKKSDTVLHVGITADEIDRMLAIRANWNRQGWKVEADLLDSPEMTREKQMDLCFEKFGFIPLLYRLNFKHNNCGGFCVKAGKAQMARLLWHSRPNYLHHETQELLHQRIFNHTSTIMRDEWTRAGVRGATPLTLRQFRERMETRWKGMLPGFDPFDGLEDTPGCKWCEAA